MTLPNTLWIAGIAAALTLLNNPSYAFDLDGAWTDNVSACGKIFEKNKQDELSIVSGSGIYGDAFVINGNAIANSSATCTIKARKVVGPVTHLVATCAAGNVALSTFQFSCRIKDENTNVRIFPGLEELDQTYRRCRF
jgi:hypothetical protein